jgi:hypothetical protein
MGKDCKDQDFKTASIEYAENRKDIKGIYVNNKSFFNAHLNFESAEKEKSIFNPNDNNFKKIARDLVQFPDKEEYYLIFKGSQEKDFKRFNAKRDDLIKSFNVSMSHFFVEECD